MADESKLPIADLPGDLPEDWKLNDAVSPNGTDTGKTKQHGYNYLMKMVNSVHDKVNDIIVYLSGLHDHSNKLVLDKINQSMLDTILYFTDSEVDDSGY